MNQGGENRLTEFREGQLLPLGMFIIGRTQDDWDKLGEFRWLQGWQGNWSQQFLSGLRGKGIEKKKVYLHSGVSTMKNFNLDSWHF